MAKNSNPIPSVLAFEKKLVPSDGFLYGTNWEKRHLEKSTSLKLIEKSVRGTISNRLKSTIQNDPLKINAEVEKANLQKVDACALGENQDTLHLHFTLKILGNIDKPSACNKEEFQVSYAKATQKYIEQEGFTELAKRYAINIANGRFLWRNRVGAEKIEVIVNNVMGENEPLIFDATEFSLKNFNSSNPKVQFLASKIADALSGKIPYALIHIDAYVLMGKAQEVYPSEELVLNKGKGDKSKILYHVNDVAAMHSQKIGNAIRTIDTWYPEFSEDNIGPIAIEPYGAVTNLGKAYRNKDKTDFYSLFDRFSLGENLADKTEEHYVMAVLVRGGVFGQSSKE